MSLGLLDLKASVLDYYSWIVFLEHIRDPTMLVVELSYVNLALLKIEADYNPFCNIPNPLTTNMTFSLNCSSRSECGDFRKD